MAWTNEQIQALYERASDECWWRMLRDLPPIDRDHLPEEPPGGSAEAYVSDLEAAHQAKWFMARWFKPIAWELGWLWVTLRLHLDAITVSKTWGKNADDKAQGFGVRRRPHETDPWLIERLKLCIFIQSDTGQYSASSHAKVRRAIAWFLGIVWEDANWETTILPEVDLVENYLPDLRSYEVYPVKRYMVVRIPWKFLSKRTRTAFTLSVGVRRWREYREKGFNGGILNGRHLLTDVQDFVDFVACGGVRIQVWVRGFKMSVAVGQWTENRVHGFGAVPLSALSDRRSTIPPNRWAFWRDWVYEGPEVRQTVGRRSLHPHFLKGV